MAPNPTKTQLHYVNRSIASFTDMSAEAVLKKHRGHFRLNERKNEMRKLRLSIKHYLRGPV